MSHIGFIKDVQYWPLVFVSRCCDLLAKKQNKTKQKTKRKKVVDDERQDLLSIPCLGFQSSPVYSKKIKKSNLFLLCVLQSFVFTNKFHNLLDC